ncbi:recombinase family protein [Holophaga foetida]|uniref:recombinase family protein n=1 Tax=Holophaga foetida TaxID=35839 RepID=UPI0002474963|nr:recombinase family protein [Holophaga foetida]
MATKGQRIAYVRVSTDDQNTARQLESVKAMSPDQTFEEKISGKSKDRPALAEMLRFVRTGDEVIVHSMDRLARNLDDLRSIVSDLTGRGVKLTFIKESMTFTGEDSPMSKLMLSVMGAFAEFERSIMLERQREGIAVAKAEGKYKGRKPSLNEAQAVEVKRRAEAGEPKAALAREFHVSRETLYSYLR